jgi:hypothetical protein
VATAVTFLWLGMVLAISFLEAPLKFRAPGVSVPIGLGIGRLVFRALNGVELVLAVLLLVVVFALPASPISLVAALVAAAVLVLQLVAVRPFLNRRTRAVLAGDESHGSRAHLVYIAAEAVKVALLITCGIASLSW